METFHEIDTSRITFVRLCEVARSWCHPCKCPVGVGSINDMMTQEYKNMIVEFSIYPVGSEHFSDKIAKVVNVLERRNVEFQVGPMGTSLRGTWDEVMPAIRECHEMLARGGERVITSLTIDDRREDTHDLKERVETVARKAAS